MRWSVPVSGPARLRDTRSLSMPFFRPVRCRTVLSLTVSIAIALSIMCAPSGADTPPSLDVQIGQMLMVGFRGCAVDDASPIIRDIRTRHIGGVILFDYDVPTRSPVRNIASPEQVRRLVSALRKAASHPLLVAIDQEGGRVNRLKEKFGFPPSVSQQQLGEINDGATTERYARTTAETLAGLGINTNFAPVVDLNTNPDNPIIGRLGRSFSADPAVVIRQAGIVIDALHDAHIVSAIKHFPGHGSSTGDSHRGLVDVTATWSPVELTPFKAIIDTGRCDMVMTAHICNEQLDARWPATLSRTIISGILRDRWHYDGVVVSDDMQMQAIRDYYGLEQAIERAIIAGCDLLVFANNSIYDADIARRAISIIRGLVHRGIISAARIGDSWRRIEKLKEGLL